MYTDFFLEFTAPFFDGLATIFGNIGKGLFQMFNVINYIDVVNDNPEILSGAGIAVLIVSVLCLIIIYGILLYAIFILVKRIFRYRKNLIKNEGLIDEIDRLNTEVVRYKQENTRLLGLAGDDAINFGTHSGGKSNNVVDQSETRFFRLSKVDSDMVSYEPEEFNNEITLEEFCQRFRNYSASKLKLYYDEKIIKLFVASLASNKLIILQGISGTGKTSLAYAFGNMIKNETTVASVQPSWRDSSELFGYFNEFTKKFNETKVLTKLYEARYKEDIFVTLLDEMNISRVEYYFAEMLSILELPNKEDWVLDLVPNAWPNDPKYIENGRFKLPENMWYIGTINNDDSTFMVTDKVYDRAMPINIDTKSQPFNAPETEAISITYTHLMDLFKEAQEKYVVKDEVLNKIDEMDKYVVTHFRLAFGNRILKHIKEFVPVYVACGGSELEALDYVIANKILRKFEQLNLAFIKTEIDGFIEYINIAFGANEMKECIEYLERLKRMI